MYATMTVENLPVSTPRISRDRRAHESNFNYLLTGICALIGATAIAVAAAGTALAVSNNACGWPTAPTSWSSATFPTVLTTRNQS